MKNLSKKIISLIMALLILVTAIPTNIFANGIDENSKEDSKVTTLQITEPEVNPVYIYYLEHPEEFKYGYIPPKYILPFEESSGFRMQFRKSNLPPKFITDLNYVTSVKNQFKTGTCWAHAAISTVETLIAKNFDIDINSLNLSEGHMALNSGRYYNLKSGGNNYAAWRYFSTLAGPVSDENFKDYKIVENSKDGDLEQMTDASNMHHEYYISEAKEYKNTKENIKSAVYNNYSVASGYYFDEKKAIDLNHPDWYHCINKKNGVPITNHQVTIVGWDDNLEIEGHKGAFLVKNSWGTNAGKDGYYWITYDSFTDKNLLVFTKVENKIENAKKVYTYPDANVSKSFMSIKCNNKTASIIGTFDRNTNNEEEITKINLYNPSENGMDYTLYITQDEALQESNQSVKVGINGKYESRTSYTLSSGWEERQSGTINDRGYTTIDLKKPYKLNQKSFGLRLDIKNTDKIVFVSYNPDKATNPFQLKNVYGYKQGYFSPNIISSDGEKLFLKVDASQHKYIDLTAITRAVSNPSIEITGPEKSWETKEGYDKDNIDPLTLTVKNNGNVSLNNLVISLDQACRENFTIINQDKLPDKLEKNGEVKVQIKPTKQITLENDDRIFNVTLKVKADELENPVTKDFTFKVTVDVEARQKALNEAKAKAKAEITKEKLKDLSDEEISKFIKQINDAKTIEAVNGIVDEAKKLNEKNLNDRKELENKAEKAVENLETLGENANAEDIKAAQNLINQLKDEELKIGLQNKLNAVIKLTEVKAAKVKAIDAINKLPKIDAKKQGFIDRVNSVTTAEDANKVFEEAKKLSDDLLTAEEKLKKAKEEAIKSISAENMPDLTNKEREDFEIKIKNAETVKSVENFVKEAKNQNEKNQKDKQELIDAKKNAVTTINNLQNIENEKSGFISEVENAKDIDSVNAIVEKAKNKSKENTEIKEALDKAKAEAKDKINATNMPDLTKEQRESFENEIDKATKAEDLNNIVERATKANKDAKDELDRENEAKNALEKLKTNDNVTKEDIDAVQNLINNLKDGSTKTDLQNKLNLIKAAHELSLKKTEAKETINGLTNIDDLKAGYLEEVDTAISTEVIEQIVEKATAKSKEITDFNKAKEDTKNKINSLENLKTEEKDKFLKDLDNIVDTAKIESVKSICLEAVKTNAKNIINGEALKDLTEKEKASALEKIEKATNEDEINKIIEDAKNQDEINKAAAKSLEEAKIKGKEIVNQDNMKFLTTDEIAAFIARIESATTPDKVKEVVNEATALNHSRDLEKILNDKRKEAIKEIDELKNLEFSQIQMLKTKIANAMSLDEIDQVMEEARNLDRTNRLREDLENNSLWNYLPRIDRYERRVNPTPLAKASDKKDKGEKVETKTPVAIKMDSKLVIGSKTLVVTVDGVQKEVKMDVEPFISNNRTMLPIRFVAEALGLKVDWDDPSRTVILTDKDTIVKIPVDTNKIIVNGVEYESDTDPILKSNRTMLPIANIARALGLVDGKDIIWDSKTQSVTIKVNK